MNKGTALAICTTALGDTLLCTPAISALGAVYDLDVLVHQHRRPLLWHNPAVKRILAYRNNPLFRAWLAVSLLGRFYEKVVVLHANNDVQKLLPRLRYKEALNIQGWQNPELKLSSVSVDSAMHVADQRLQLAERADAPTIDPRMRLYLTPQEKAWAQSWLAERGLGSENPRVALCVGAAYPYKMWPAENFGLLAKHLAERGVICLVVGSASESRLAHQVRMAAGLPTVNAMGLPLRQACALIGSTDLLVSNDTGPLHIAQSLGTPVLGLFGPTSPDTIGPRNPWDRVIQAPVICQPCSTKRCPEAGCMQAIKVEEVVALARTMLATPKPEKAP